MAPTKEEKKSAKPEEPNYVTQEQLEKVTGTLMAGMDKIMERLDERTQSPPDAKQASDVKKASSDSHMQVPPDWEEKAREIIGEALDHCELSMPPKGGTLFTVIIRNEHSNAPKDYLDRYKADRRTKEIGNDGVAGVEDWCKLISLNLKKK